MRYIYDSQAELQTGQRAVSALDTQQGRARSAAVGRLAALETSLWALPVALTLTQRIVLIGAADYVSRLPYCALLERR
jgi:hypothetical protein